jgi:hypothetical protein
MQVFLSSEPIWDVWVDEENEGKFTHTQAQYLALCADGEVRSMTLCDGYLELTDAVNLDGDYKGYFTQDQLKDYPTAE